MEIKEVKNNQINIDAFKFANDAFVPKLEYPLNLVPFNHFFLIVGRPNSGKTNLILNMLTRKRKCYYKKFNKIYIFSASMKTQTRKFALPDDQMFSNLDFAELESIVSKEQEENNKILFVFDDVISSISKNQSEFLKLVYNRRHIGGGASIWLVSQVYNKIPLEIRKVCDALFFFEKKKKKEIESIYNDIVLVSKDKWEKIIQYCFQNDHDLLFYIVNQQLFFRNFNLLEFS